MSILITDLELNDNNLYQNGRIINFEADNEQILTRDKYQTTGSLNDKYHVVRQGDRLDLIAYWYYSSVVEDASKFWWLIADANNIHKPMDISNYIGSEILIPDLQKALLEI